MTGFTGVNKKSRCTGAGERGGNFAGDMAGFPHAYDNNTAFAVKHVLASPGEIIVYTGNQIEYFPRFSFDNTLTQFYQIFRI